jgi:hypothetical protein
MLFKRKVGFVVEKTVKNIWCVSVGTFYGKAEEWGIIVRNKGM